MPIFGITRKMLGMRAPPQKAITRRVPASFRAIPQFLVKSDPPTTPEEWHTAMAIRRPYCAVGDMPDPYMNCPIRAFRLLEGAQVYIEVGTRDKGNIAWVARTKLVPGATIIDVDIEEFPEHERMLRAELKNDFAYHRIVGDSISDEVLDQVRTALGGRLADGIFCDSSHLYTHTLAEFDRYFSLIRPGGVLMFHDCYWEGNDYDKGKSQALAQIDRFNPVWVSYTDEPIHRFLPLSSKGGDSWAGVAIILQGEDYGPLKLAADWAKV
jgi:predicted O-methyltransferase YrrM